MYRKDFILRMMDMLAEMIAGILGLIKRGDHNEASLALENAFQELLNKDMNFFLAIPEDNLASILLEEHNYTNNHLEVLSELFYAQAELDYSLGRRTESLALYAKSMKLLNFVMLRTDTFSMKHQTQFGLLKRKLEELAE